MQIPQSWSDVLAAIQQVCPDAVMAGGCLRDLDNERPIKDIDIFVRGRGYDELKRVCDRLSNAGLECASVDTDSLYPVGDGELTGFFTVCFPKIEQPIQIIMVDWPTDEIVERFDYGICRIAFDGQKIIRPTEYEEDKAAEVFRLRRPREGQELIASVHRYARLIQKYEGWKFDLFEEDLFDGWIG